jgi:hypothetical protein
MSATYTSPDNSDSDWVRFKLGDTDVSGDNADLSDEEIAAMLAEKGNKWPAAHACALAIARRYQLQAMRAANEDLADIAGGWRTLANEIFAETSAEGIAPYMPARSIDEKDATLDDSDRVSPAFTRDMHRMGDSATAFTDDNLT